MKNENLEKLLSRFMSQCDAEQSLHDIELGDILFDQNPAPQVSEQTIQKISSQVRCSLRKQKQHLFIFKLTAAAALIAITLLLGIYALSSSETSHSDRYVASNSQNFWTQMTLHDEILTRMEEELTQVAQSINDISLDEEPHKVKTFSIDTLELEELELMAANNDFWKG